jgi:hypothetical protein
MLVCQQTMALGPTFMHKVNTGKVYLSPIQKSLVQRSH